jgi:hypothetical protein
MGKIFTCEKCSGAVNDSDRYCSSCGSQFDAAFKTVTYDKGKDHLTAIEKSAILAMLNQGVYEGKVGKKNYKIEEQGKGYMVSIQEMTRGLVPVPGSPLRSSVRKVLVSVK